MTHAVDKPRTFSEWLKASPRQGDCHVNVYSSAELRGASPQAKGTVGLGGHVVGDSAMQSLDRALLGTSALLRFCTTHRTVGGSAMPIVLSDDTANAASIVSENIIKPTLDTPFSQLVLNSFAYHSGSLVVSRELVEDGVLKTSDWFTTLGLRLGRKLNTDFTVGSGSGEPRGLCLDAGDSGITAASTTTPTLDELLDLQGSVDSAYAESDAACWMLHPSTWTLIKKAFAAEAAAFLRPRGETDGYDMLAGNRVLLNSAMATGAGSKAVLFGDLSRYHVRLVQPVTARAVSERLADYDQTIYFLIQRADGALSHSAAVKFLSLHA